MAFQKNKDLVWVTVNPSSLKGESAKLFDAIGQAREAFKTHWIKEAHKAGALKEGETLIVSHKAWGFSMAKVEGKAGKAGAKADPKAMFANLG